MDVQGALYQYIFLLKKYIVNRQSQYLPLKTLIYMYFLFRQGLNLLDKNLTTARLMGIITAERLHPTNLTSCLDEEVLVHLHHYFVLSDSVILLCFIILLCVNFGA